VIKRIKRLIEDIRWMIDSNRFKKNRFKKGRGDDFHHE